MSAVTTGLSGPILRGRVAFRQWRWQRPFWAGLLTILGGIPIGYLPYNNMTFGQLSVRIGTTAGAGASVIGVLLIVLGLTMWFQSAVRIFSGVASILLGLVSMPVTNFGGFGAFVLAILGGALAVSWAPGVPGPDLPGHGTPAPGLPAQKTQAPEGAPRPEGGAVDPDWPAPTGPAVPVSPPHPFTQPESAQAGPRPDDEETTEENGRHRAG